MRYLAAFAEYAALAGALRVVRPPARGPDGGDRLRAVALVPHPLNHQGTVARFKRWIPYLQRLGCDLEILASSTAAQFEDYRAGKRLADSRYYHACVHSQWRNIRRAARADVVILHRGLFPFSPWQRPTFERQLARLNPHLVYDFYDAIWVQAEAASQQGSVLGRWLHPPGKIEELIRLSRVVTVSNEPLAEFARRHHDDVRLVPMLLEPEDFEERIHKERSPVVLGWLGSRYNLPRLLALAPALRRVAAERDIIVRVVAPDRVEMPGVPVDSQTHPWSAEREREDLAGLDVGLLPLADTPTDRGKSPFKLLQYLAAGLAVVATPIAMDFDTVKPHESFLPATTEDEWVAAIIRLIDDPLLRARLGAAARQTVVDHYSFESHASALLDALLTAAGRPMAKPGKLV